MAKDKIYAKGMRGFKPRDNAPDFVLGTLVLTPNELFSFLKSEEVKPFLTEYKGNKQVKFNVLRSKDGGLSFELDTYKATAKKDDDEPVF